MICEECKGCWNYKVCENGCHGSTEPCEHLIPKESLQAYTLELGEALDNFKNILWKELRESLERAKSVMKTLSEVVSDSTKQDPSRRRFEAVACRGRNRKRRK